MEYRVSDEIKGLIFDFDGTIVDSMPVHFLSWQEAFAHYNAEFNEDFFYKHAGVSLPVVVEHYNKENGTNLDPCKIADLKNELHLKYIPETKLIMPVFKIIKAYYGKLPMAIATGNSRLITLKVMQVLGIKHFFKGVVSGDDVKNPKPAPDCFLKAARIIEITPRFCEVFEDGEPGLQGAQAAGMKATDVRDWR